MKILIADKFEKAGVEGLKATGADVVYEPEAGPTLAQAIERVKPAILIVRSTKVPGGIIEKAEGLKGIIRAGAGVDNIEVPAATARGIRVCNCAGMNAVAVAELTFALMLACDRRIPDQSVELRSGKWNKKEYSRTGTGGARGLKGTTLGVVGCGAIGRAVIKRAHAFEMKVLAWSRSITAEHTRDLGAEWGGNDTPALHELAARSDIVSVHLPAAPDTVKIIGARFFEAMKPGAYLINTSRGTVVDEAALAAAVQQKGIRAGLDVYEKQPSSPQADFDCAVSKLPGVYTTHHSGASTDQAQNAVADETVRLVKVYLQTGRFENCVNAGPVGERA